jgi:hypothetical protein
VYPEYEWNSWKFPTRPVNSVEDMKDQREWMDWAETQLNIKEKSDWYKVKLTVNILSLL